MKYGIERMLEDLEIEGFMNTRCQKDSTSNNHAIIPEYEISMGRFSGRIIELAIPCPDDYPRSIGTCIHVKSSPLLLDVSNSLKDVRNITLSKLGEDWRYWSFKLRLQEDEPTKHLMHQINGIFRNI